MNIEQFKNFMTLEKPKDRQIELRVFPNMEIAKMAFNDSIAKLKNEGVSFQFNISNLTVTNSPYGELVFMSVNNVARQTKGRQFTSVYVHPTINEVHI